MRRLHRLFREFEKDPLNAYAHIFTQNKWIADKKSSIETNKIKLKDLLDQLGEFEGYELIRILTPNYLKLRR